MTRAEQDEKGGRKDKIIVAVGAVILDEDDRILLVKHVEAKRGGFWFGKWICPGGKLQHGESISVGTKREIREETGLEISLIGKPIVFERVIRESNDKGLHVVYVDHLARKTKGELNAGSDVAIAKWFSKRELHVEWEQLHEDTQRLLREAKIVKEDDVPIIA